MKTVNIFPIFDGEDYGDMIRTVLNFQPPGMGFTIEQMQKRLKILDKLDNKKSELALDQNLRPAIELEDEEANELLRAVNLMDGNWGRIDHEIIEFVARIKKDVA